MGFRLNTTASYPEGVYRMVSSEWGKKDLVEVCLPERIKALAIERGYLKEEGRCGGHPPLIKQVAGIGGDYIEISNVVIINGEEIENSEIKTRDGQGEALNPSADGIVKQEHVWLLSTVTDSSFDSRYFGSINERYVIGKLEPLWTF